MGKRPSDQELLSRLGRRRGIEHDSSRHCQPHGAPLHASHRHAIRHEANRRRHASRHRHASHRRHASRQASDPSSSHPSKVHPNGTSETHSRSHHAANPCGMDGSQSENCKYCRHYDFHSHARDVCQRIQSSQRWTRLTVRSKKVRVSFGDPCVVPPHPTLVGSLMASVRIG